MTKKIAGFVAATVDEDGEVYEFTDPMPTRAKAVRFIQRSKTWLSFNPRKTVKVRTMKYSGLAKHLYRTVSQYFSE